MKDKILQNITLGKYRQNTMDECERGFINTEGGWTDYLIFDKIIFSHRTNNYPSGELLDSLHSHDYYELTLIAAANEAVYISDKQSTPVDSGMAILTKPMQMHMFRLEKPTCYDRFVLYFKNISDIFPDRSIMDFTEMGNDAYAVFAPPNDILLTYARAAEAALSDTSQTHVSAKAYLNICALFLALLEHKSVSVSSTYVPHFISEIKEYIDKNYLNIRSVGDVTEHFFYSREYMSRSFRQYYNTPLYEYILMRKMLYCCTLLRQGKSVSVAAHTSGFHNMPSFVKLFQKFNGCTPSEYKAKNQ